MKYKILDWLKIKLAIKMSLVIFIILSLALFLFSRTAQSSEKVAEESASLVKKERFEFSHSSLLNQPPRYLVKERVIKKVLKKYHSPLASYSGTFIDACLKHDLDCYLLPAISGLESSFGIYIYPDSYNPFGWGGGYIKFENWEEGIETVARALRENYLDQGVENLYQIGRIYAPPSQSWANRVDFYLTQFYNEEDERQILPLSFF